MFESPDDRKILKKMHKEIQVLIEKKISVYLSDKAEEVVEAMIQKKNIPEFSDDIYGQMRKNDLKRVTKEIFKLEPLIFHKLKHIQEKSLLVFEFALSSEERENVLTIIEQVVELSPQQRTDFQ